VTEKRDVRVIEERIESRTSLDELSTTDTLSTEKLAF
jgi:hypothetical protein